jgi:predicted PurR-regulated permease PerM
MPDDIADRPSRAPAQVVPANVPGLNSLLALAIGVVIITALYLAREVLIPITLAVLLTFVLSPVVMLLRHIHVPRVLAVLLSVLFAIIVLLSLASVIGVQVGSLASDLPRYASSIETKVGAVRGFATNRIERLVSRLGRGVQNANEGKAVTPNAASTAPQGTVQKPIPVEVQKASPTPLEIAQRILSPVLAPLEDTLIVLIVAIFILLQKEDLRDRLIRLFGSGDLHRTTTAMDDAAHRLSRYFLSQLGINAVFGVIIGVGLFFIGVPSPVLWGILGTLLRFVPYIGSVISGTLPTLLAAGVSPGWDMAIETAALFVVVETITGQFVEPMVYGHSTGLSPAAVVIAAIFWTWLWGPIGLILSTPLTLCLVVLGRYVDRLEFLDVILGDRPALTPVENFYQRMLAGDTDEAQDQAEQLLKERSLSSYYDEVVLKGLQLAATDAQRGVLMEGQVERIQQAVQALVVDLGSHGDADPRPADAAAAHEEGSAAEKALPKQAAPGLVPLIQDQLAPEWRTEAPVLCIAGRGPLDEAASSMLAQLLGKHGLGARVTSYEAASRDRINTLDVEGVAMVCISYLELSGAPSHLRYLVRRVRRRLPHAPLLVGLWPAEDAALKDEQMHAMLGATYYTSSLHEAVDDCLQAAREAPGALAQGAGAQQGDVRRSEPESVTPPLAPAAGALRPA